MLFLKFFCFYYFVNKIACVYKIKSVRLGVVVSDLEREIGMLSSNPSANIVWGKGMNASLLKYRLNSREDCALQPWWAINLERQS